ncbi:hypothetical protein EIP91_006225 [Steccherinum ochraceum]|uniref:DUF6535 domain-containing protein n=1 Tax=Steccherinum ochraceum TaxID=92696 RepID=A0A4V2MVK0_9APHY|nr:hypothetical protein EIP91_006225 [Steccherinum ochraceum]
MAQPYSRNMKNRSGGTRRHDDVLQEILSALKSSSIISPQASNKRMRMWHLYSKEAEDFDGELYDKYDGSMDSVMIFAGLFTAADATFASIMRPDLSPDPNLQTQALLQAVISTFNATSQPLTILEWTGPSRTTVWVQSLLYASLACSLFAALGGLLGKQWLSNYKTIEERGTIEARCKDRQRKLDGMKRWRFLAILDVLPTLLQLSLLLFGLALSAYMWDIQPTVAMVLIAANVTGTLFYLFVVVASLLDPDCPFQIPLSKILRKVPRYLHFAATYLARNIWRCAVHLWAMSSPIRKPSSFSDAESQVTQGDERMIYSSKTLKRDIQSLEQVAPQKQCLVSRGADLLDDGRCDPFLLQSIIWLSETSTNPVVLADAMHAVLEIKWSKDSIIDFPVDFLDSLLSWISTCFHLDPHGRLLPIYTSMPRLEVVSAAFLLIYWEKSSITPRQINAWADRSGRRFVDQRQDVLEALRKAVEHERRTSLSLLQQTLEWDVVARTSASHSSMSNEPVSSVFTPIIASETIFSRATLRLAQTLCLTADPACCHLLTLLETNDWDKLATVTTSDEVWSDYFLTFATSFGCLHHQVIGLDETQVAQLARIGPAFAMELTLRRLMVLLNDFIRDQGADPGTTRRDLSRWLSVLSQFITAFTRTRQTVNEYIYHFQLSDLCLETCLAVWRCTLPEPRALTASTDLIGSLLAAMRWIVPGTQHKQSWTPHISHLHWMTDFLATNCQVIEFLPLQQHKNGHILTIARLFAGISQLPHTAILDAHLSEDGKLLSSIDWALRCAASPRYRGLSSIPALRAETLSLIDFLLSPVAGTNNAYAALSNKVTNFAERLCVAAAHTPADGTERSWHHDQRFVSIVCKIAGSNMLTWMNDPANDVYIRRWVNIIARWHTLPTGDAADDNMNAMERMQQMGALSLLHCDRIFSSTDIYWSASQVTGIAVVLLAVGWRIRAANLENSHDANVLAFRTVTLLRRLHFKCVPTLHWWLEHIYGSLLRTLAVSPDLEPTLRQAKDALEEKVVSMKSSVVALDYS